MPNPQHKYVIQIYTHLQEVHMEDSNNKEFSKVHVILGASEYVNIKTKKYIKLGKKENKSLNILLLDGPLLQEESREPAAVLC